MLTMLQIIQVAAVLLCLLVLLWRKGSFYLFKRPLENIPGPASLSWWKGNLGQLFNRHGWDFQDELGEQYGPVVKLHGLVGRKMLYVYDPVALYEIIIKDPYTFEPLKWFTSFVTLVFGPGLPAIYGDQHRKQRKLLNPVFSGNHIRSLTPMFYEVAHKMRECISAELNGSAKEVNLLVWVHRAALEVLGRGGLGYSLDPIDAQPSDTYGEALKAVSPVVFSLGYLRMMSPLIGRLTTPIRRFLVQFVPSAGVRQMAHLSRVMDDKAKEIFYAKKAAVFNGVQAGKTSIVSEGDGKDIMSVLLSANMAADKADQLPEDQLIGQMSTLVFAGTDTTTSAISQVIDLLSHNPAVQEKLRAEIIEARGGGDITHDALVALPYLDAVCRETLRLYSPVSFVYRGAGKDVILPLSKPMRGVDGTLMNEIHVEKGTTLVIGIRGSNLNQDIWGPDAKEWKPERWLSPLPDAVKDAKIPGVYSNLMTFLGGGRSCIGFKFSQLEMKVVLSVLLSSFRFSRSKDIYWNLSTFTYPTAGRTSSQPEMPIRVESL